MGRWGVVVGEEERDVGRKEGVSGRGRSEWKRFERENVEERERRGR